jgi:hypothetical protein
MGYKKDKQILELLKQKVLEKDKEMERKSYHSATKEALAELTSLSNEEVEKIYSEVKADVEKDIKQRRKRIMWISALILIVLSVVTVLLIEYMRKPAVYVEDFSKPDAPWSFTDSYGTVQYLENGEFIMDVKKEQDYLQYIDHIIDFPRNFSIEADVRKISGQNESLGFYLGKDYRSFGYFFIRYTGKFRYGFSLGGDWQDNPDWSYHEAIKADENATNNLMLKVTGNTFEFFINGTPVAQGHLHKLKLLQYSLAVGGTQKVAFDNLTILNTNTQDTVFINTFDTEIEPWTEKKEILKQAEFVDSSLRITVNADEACYWATGWLPQEFLTTESYEITLKGRFVKADYSGYAGFMLIQDDKNYHVFEVKDASKARICTLVNGEYKYVGAFTESGIENETADKHFEIRILKTGDKVEMYYNNRFVDRIKVEDWLYWNDLERMGLRVCNNQIIDFERLTIKEIK